MRENQTVFPHRACGFAAGAAPIPGMGFIELVSSSHALVSLGRDKVAAGETPAALTTLVLVL
jgi:hypothetical protein